jgi:hypothetical protein
MPKFKQQSISTQYANAHDQEDVDSEYVLIVIEHSESSALLISNYLFRSSYEDVWILDTGDTQHMTFQRDLFLTFQECQLNSIFLVDDTTHTPCGKGTVKVSLSRIGEKMISNVWYVPTFKNNLLSLVMIRQSNIQIFTNHIFITLIIL